MKTLVNFKNKADFHKYLKENSKELLELKKEQIKHGDSIGGFFKRAATKSTHEANDTLVKTIIGNTYLWMDSHMDVHAKGCFSKSISERGDKIWHLHDHEHKLTAKVGTPQEVYEGEIDWETLGVQKAGATEALFMTSEIKKELNPRIFNAYKSGEIDQHSVGMRYIKIQTAYDDDEDKVAKALWDEYYPQLGNHEEADKHGVFWVVKEAKLIEISCVLEGSNSLTPTLEDKAEPHKSTPPEPSNDTQNTKTFYSNL